MPFETKYICDECSYEIYQITPFRPKEDVDCPVCPQCDMHKVTITPRKKTRSKGVMKLRGDVKSYTDRAKNIKDIIDSKQAPSIRDSTNKTKAFDATAEIVMQDYGMTDINMNSHMREGDNCVPKLASELERQVDNVFKPRKNNVMGMAGGSINAALTKSINAGAFNNYGDVVARQQASGIKVPVNIVGEYNGKPA